MFTSVYIQRVVLQRTIPAAVVREVVLPLEVAEGQVLAAEEGLDRVAEDRVRTDTLVLVRDRVPILDPHRQSTV